MTSTPIRDQARDHLITPQNSALLLIDYQPSQIGAVRSMDRADGEAAQRMTLKSETDAAGKVLRARRARGARKRPGSSSIADPAVRGFLRRVGGLPKRSKPNGASS